MKSASIILSVHFPSSSYSSSSNAPESFKSSSIFSNSQQQPAPASTSLASLGNFPQTVNLRVFCSAMSSLRPTSTLSFGEVLDSDSLSSPSLSGGLRELVLPKTDRSGRLSSPRAARELALLLLYAACLEGSDPVRLFDKRLHARREWGSEFNEASLLEYNHMSFGGPPVTTDTLEETEELLRIDDRESEIEAEVLSAPLKLVYSKLNLRFTRKLLVAVVEMWDSHVSIIDQVIPQSWKNEPTGRVLELSILHLAMSEIKVVGTRHQIVINEAVDLAKRFCDGAAPRTVNGCLRTFVDGLEKGSCSLS